MNARPRHRAFTGSPGSTRWGVVHSSVRFSPLPLSFRRTARFVACATANNFPAERREVLAARIRERAVAWAVAAADAFEIDHVNIYQASRLAMRRAVEKLQSPAGLPLNRRRTG